MQKTKQLLEHVQQDYIDYLKSHKNDLPVEVQLSVPKISRGENYLGLPFLILDYPRCFKMENTFAIRTMFWWGNFFSITLHLSGSYKKNYENSITRWYPLLKKEKYFISISQNEWEHHFEKSNYAGINTLSKAGFEKNVQKHFFLKIAYKIPVSQWNETAEKLLHHFKILIGLTGQLPRR
ncbi:MAG TPA: hypothetical protein VHD35_09400 [Chitinophagaceae bacterium]|nr:hypothetical protein [Chitinophagaceae bacterium]